MNFIPASIDDSKKVRCNNIEINCDVGSYSANDNVQLAIRPEEIQFQQENQDDNVVPGVIKEIEFLGSFQRVYFETKNFSDELIIVDVPSSNAKKIKMDINNEMSLYFSKEDARIYSI
jgi:ABC-type Fe3+/spermidine/putrescine transport system ATPase subunit